MLAAQGLSWFLFSYVLCGAFECVFFILMDKTDIEREYSRQLQSAIVPWWVMAALGSIVILIIGPVAVFAWPLVRPRDADDYDIKDSTSIQRFIFTIGHVGCVAIAVAMVWVRGWLA